MKRNFLFLFAMSVMVAFTFSCKNEKKVEETATTATTENTTAAISGTYSADSTMSKVMWVGSKPGGKHNGTINVKSGSIAVTDGNITGGSIILDMNSINVLDLTGGEKAGLEGHLKGAKKGEEDHFFNVAKFPTAKFDVTKVTGLTGDSTATHLVYGNLTVKDVTKEVNFKANVSVDANGVSVSTQPFDINRTDFGVKYGSKTFFSNLKDKFIEDMISVQISLKGKK
ncbi:MAG: hypothetical protein RLZZ546_3120 [Bacteroidota bacterium]|jgi:polyisoprenoid-binding protein YceI